LSILLLTHGRGSGRRGKKLPVVLLDDGGVLNDNMLRAGQKGQPVGQARVSAIPNIELLCQLLGVPLLSPAHLSHLA
jgi:hypothetical protein